VELAVFAPLIDPCGQLAKECLIQILSAGHHYLRGSSRV
jgi:hypothetical protein